MILVAKASLVDMYVKLAWPLFFENAQKALRMKLLNLIHWELEIIFDGAPMSIYLCMLVYLPQALKCTFGINRFMQG